MMNLNTDPRIQEILKIAFGDKVGSQLSESVREVAITPTIIIGSDSTKKSITSSTKEITVVNDENGVTKRPYNRWTQDEIDTLIKLVNNSNLTHQEIAEKLGKTLSQVRDKLHYLRHNRSDQVRVDFKGKSTPGTRYTPKEIRLLKDSRYSDSQLSLTLGRSISSIRVKRCKMRREIRELGDNDE